MGVSTTTERVYATIKEVNIGPMNLRVVVTYKEQNRGDGDVLRPRRKIVEVRMMTARRRRSYENEVAKKWKEYAIPRNERLGENGR